MFPVSMLADHLWQSTLVAALAGLLTLAFRNNRAKVRYWFWLAASLKFLIPFAALTALGGRFGWLAPVRIVRVEMNVVTDAVTGTFSPAELGAVAAASTASPRVVDALPVLLVAVWFTGGVLLLAVWCVRWWRISSAVRRTTAIKGGRELDILRRLERRGGITRPIAPIASDRSREPGVFDPASRPAVAVRSGQSLGDAQWRRLLTNSRSGAATWLRRAHARSRVLVPPAVWWVGARMVDERERACDEEVIRSAATRRYAESILRTCAVSSRHPASVA